MQEHLKIKIEQLEPNNTNFQLYFEIAEIINKKSDYLQCRLVDDTGIVNAYFHKYVNKLNKGEVYLMTNLKVGLVNEQIRVQMTQNTVVSKQPDIMGFKDKANDISKRIYKQKIEQKKYVQNGHKIDKKQQKNNKIQKITQVISDNSRKSQSLIPFSKQQALNQLKMKQQFQQNFKNKHNNIKDNNKQQKQQLKQNKQQKQHIQYKQKQAEKVQKQLLYKQKQVNYKQKANQNKTTQYKQKNAQNTKQHQDKIQYKLKQQDQKQTKQGRLYKAKSLVYKPKIQQKNGYKQIDHKTSKIDKNNDNYKHNQNKQINNNKFKEKQHKKNNQQHKKSEQIKKNIYDNHQKQKQHTKPQKSQTKPSQTNIKSQTTIQQKGLLKISQKKQHKGEIDIINIPSQSGNCVNLKAWITKKIKTIVQTSQIQKLIADTTGSVWLRCNKINLQNQQVYQIDNLQVCKDQNNRFYLKQSQFTEARRIQGTLAFNLRQINTKQ